MTADLLHLLRQAVRNGKVRVCEHGLKRMFDRQIDVRATVNGIHNATLIEDYSKNSNRQESRVLVTQMQQRGRKVATKKAAPVGKSVVKARVRKAVKSA